MNAIQPAGQSPLTIVRGGSSRAHAGLRGGRVGVGKVEAYVQLPTPEFMVEELTKP